jgi:hypothetical protein
MFLADVGVVEAGDGCSLVGTVDASLVGADARADSPDVAFTDLYNHVGVCDERPRHPYEVTRAVDQRGFRLVG